MGYTTDFTGQFTLDKPLAHRSGGRAFFQTKEGPTMKRYWDLNETERAALTAEEIEETYIPVELMEHGCLQPVAPVLEEETPSPELPTDTYFRVTYDCERYARSHVDVLFDNGEDAQAFLKLCSKVVTYHDAVTGYVCAPLRDPRIESAEMPTIADVSQKQAALKQAKEIRERNSKLQREYEEELRTVRKETTEIWDDWRRCTNDAATLERVRETFDEYVRLSGGDKEIARTFLGKVFPQEMIVAALGVGDLSPTLLDTLRLVGALGEEGGTVDDGAELVSQLDSLAAMGLVEHEPKGDSGHLALITTKGIDVLEKKSDG